MDEVVRGHYADVKSLTVEEFADRGCMDGHRASPADASVAERSVAAEAQDRPTGCLPEHCRSPVEASAAELPKQRKGTAHNHEPPLVFFLCQTFKRFAYMP